MLTYRGISYDRQPAGLTTRPTDEFGKYRGQTIQLRVVDNPSPAYPFAAELVYRGAAYTVGENTPEATSTLLAAEPVTFPPINTWMRGLVIKHLHTIRRREHSMLVRAAKTVGLPIKDAAEYTSHVQGKLPHDFAGYDRSPAAMS